MPENECLVVAPSPSLRRSTRRVKAPIEMPMPLKERLRGAPTPSVTKSNIVKALTEMPLKKRLREAPTPSGTKSSLGCKKELMPLKERCVETPSVTMKKPKSLKMDAFDFWVCKNNYNVALCYAESGLELYQKKNKDDVEFEIVRVLYCGKSGVDHPDFKIIQFWTHVCFTAKPKNSDCSDVSSKYFLAELMYGYDSGRWDVKHCDTFEPIDKPGLKHDCLICKDPRKTHPGPSGYVIGAPPYKEEGMAYLGSGLIDTQVECHASAPPLNQA